MKKNTMMRIASAMLVLALLTTCVISGTFAKYVKTDTASDSAHVAAFGVTVTATSNSLFKETYSRTEDLQTSVTIQNSVVADTKVVAPGTSGSLTDFIISGTPEVAVRVSYKIESLTLDNWSDGTNFYCPLIFTIGAADATNKVAVDGKNYQDANTFKNAIQNALNGFVKEYAPKTAIANTENFAISWEWPFETGENAANDVKDTALGNAATKATVRVSFSATVTQID